MADAVLLVLAVGDHQPLDGAEVRVVGPAVLGIGEVERAVEALVLAQLSLRLEAGRQLLHAVNQLVAVQLLHMNREETEVNAMLWTGLTDGDLVAIRSRLVASLPQQRHAEWMAIVLPAVNPVERRLVGGPMVG